MEYLGLVALGLLIGAYGTVIGAGGGFVLVPLLLLLYPRYDPQQVTAVSLAVVWANATSGSIAYARQRRIDYLTGLLFAASSAPGVVAGAVAVRWVPERTFSALFGAMLLALAFTAVRGRWQAVRPPLRGRGVLVRRISDSEGRTYVYAYRVWQGVGVSLAVGFVSSLFGIGGGIMHVPAMIILLHVPIQYAVATSHFILTFMAGGGSLVHLADGSLRSGQALRAMALGAGAVPGAQMGAWIAHRIRGRNVLLLLAAGIVALGLRLLVRGLLGV